VPSTQACEPSSPITTSRSPEVVGKPTRKGLAHRRRHVLLPLSWKNRFVAVCFYGFSKHDKPSYRPKICQEVLSTIRLLLPQSRSLETMRVLLMLGETGCWDASVTCNIHSYCYFIGAPRLSLRNQKECINRVCVSNDPSDRR